MRPERLNPLFAEIEGLKGVGAALARPLERLGLNRIKDLAYHLPDRFVTRYAVTALDEAMVGEAILVSLTLDSYRSSASPRAPFRVIAKDEAGAECALVFFTRNASWVKKQWPLGEARLIAGRLERFGETLQINHPEHIVTKTKEEVGAGAGAFQTTGPIIEPVYPLTYGITQKRLGSLVVRGLDQLGVQVGDLPEWIEPNLLARHGWPGWREALLRSHHGMDAKARDRLAYDELLANALALRLVRESAKAQSGQSIKGDGRLRKLLQMNFALTGAQARSLGEIEEDMAQIAPMLRLLQGDVGSGKTVVALQAMLLAVEAGAQAALLAPTEILARQHFATLRRMASGTGAETALLTGRGSGTAGKAREGVLMGLADGSISMVVGTHALFQEAVQYQNLALVVIDEQHRFGVSQRLMFTRKGKRVPHCLAMTATPIPRTLTLARHGEMDVSRLDEMPPGRLPVDTRVVALERIKDVEAALVRHLAGEKQAYWVCPAVNETEGEDIAAAQARFEELRARLGPLADKVELVHGQLPGPAKEAAMERFVSGEARLLVATTVIEVGVDVPNATLMVVEQAERFGLAQLHQLRGRVGRGEGKSTCLLLRSDALSVTARERLALLRSSEDGFFLAEEDLRLRGGGELLGTRQSGDTQFCTASLEQIQRLAPVAHDDARLLIERDGGLEGERGEAARLLLYLFERDWGVTLLRGG